MTNAQPDLQQQRVVVLGGTSGMGLATALAAQAAGATVVVVSSTPQRVAAALAQLGATAEGHVVDLGDEAAVQALFARLGPFDHLVYSAGEALQTGALASTDLAALRQFFAVRVFGALAAVKYAVPHLRGGGSIVLTGGVASARPRPGWAGVASICSAMEGLTRALALELAPIRVNLVSPGLVRTPLWDGLAEADRAALYASSAAALPVGRVGTAQDLAQTYLYALTNRYTTGQCIVADGGGVLI